MGKRALVIDDSRAMRRVIANILTERGFEVLEAENGQVALDQLEANPGIEVALVDWNMPVMNGYDFIKAVRAQPKYARLTMMMVTTETEMSQVVRALAAGANEYVMKPFTADALVEKLELLGLL
ncbi:response regulator [Plasticicumulans sp.]|uniref:response regulator n=1 Tax=Plasticicumulans sp. TaxID=2307179 RepID=UPI000FBEE960|nr:response regulator [Plasticicumulans sp.]MBS0600836.1 response regulator [Pseudomonadota bacterium]RTK97542.1 MAG: response regulator [Xanthomonadales bacterium]HMV39132.1 response regulator [Plasticicumulans sp.]HMW29830.1 response regulator [Plasticicumulans sp.]HMW41571.1 response regulator [Plasticicumulans sp.]